MVDFDCKAVHWRILAGSDRAAARDIVMVRGTWKAALRILRDKEALTYGFCVGANVPASQVKGPFSVSKPLKELQPGPPFNQMVISSAFGFVLGKNQKKSSRVSPGESEIGSKPAKLGPISKGTSGIALPFSMSQPRAYVAR